MSGVNWADLPLPPEKHTGWPWSEDSVSRRAAPPALLDGQALPRITVVTPSFNQGQFIEQTIRSVLMQGYPNLEYLIFDGGSSDGSVETIRKYEKHLACWQSEPDRGQSHAINKGFKKSTGKIICWLNSDDYFLPDTLQTVAESLADGTGIYALVGHCLKVFTDGRPPKLEKGEYRDRRSFLKFWNGYTMPQSSIFWRREIFDRVGFLDENEHYIMDFDYWARISKHFEFRNIDRTLSCATYHDKAKTGDNFAVYHQRLRENASKYWGPLWGSDYWHLRFSMYKHFVCNHTRIGRRLSSSQAKTDIRKVVPRGCAFILVDEDQWASGEWTAGRRRFPFLERDGRYWGPPADDTTAIREMERLRQSGASFIVFAWPAFWWLEYYSEFHSYLRSRYPSPVKNDRIVVFDLRS
jgi:glycosyltransferase involved in cell wall biosynthesis